MRWAITLFIWSVSFTGALAQMVHSCPVHHAGGGVYENPLNEKWLSAYDVKFYDLRLSVSNTTTMISGSAEILIEPVRALDTLVLELQDALTITKIGFSQDPANPLFDNLVNFRHREHAIFIPIGKTLEAGDLFSIRIEYHGEAGQSRGFFAGINSARDPVYGFDVTYTLSEPLNARDWFPVKQVLEDKIDSVWMNLECDGDLMAASNGLLHEIAPGENSKHTFKWQTRYPIAYYLLSFTVADYRDFSFNAPLSGEGDSVLVQNYIYDSNELLMEWEEEIRATGTMISLFSDLLTDYPFRNEKYGHAMAPLGGGMEHQTMTTIQDFSFYLVAHELAHQWFGDYITCGNWQDIWINEGFASYMEYVAGELIRGEESASAWMTNAMSIALGETKGAVFVPEEDIEDPFRLFDYGLSYKKGAILLHMIRYQLNNDVLFFKVLRTYLEQFGSGLATGDDFRTVLESVTQSDFSCFFNQWYYGEGYPRFNVIWQQEGDSLRVLSEQNPTAPEVTPLFETPFDLEIRLIDGTKSRVKLMQENLVEEFVFPVEGVVTDIQFDPDNWLLNTATVNQQKTASSKFIFGPNPVKDGFFIQLINNSQIEEIMITNMNGQEVMRNLSTDNPVLMDLSGLADGPYLLVIKESDHTYMERIVKISRN